MIPVDQRHQARMLAFLRRLKRDHPGCHALVDTARVDVAIREVEARLLTGASEFSDEADGGRGGSYRQAQRMTFARARGARALLHLFADRRSAADPLVVLDVLGGDGLVARIARASVVSSPSLTIVTSDVAPAMVEAALGAGLPALWQPAQRLILRDASVDGVLCAYGTHHLDRASLIETCEEARRVIRPGGRVVLHDFEPDSAVSRWFSEVVHRYSRKGHVYQHYGSEILTNAINDGGFENVVSRPLFDPIIAPGASPAGARLALARYLFQMYGLVGLGHGQSLDVLKKVLSRAESCFGAIGIDSVPEEDGAYRASLPRVAVFAVGCVPTR
jgi:ubiquinone/menaquinone biosynthesis C-methylase UbiE